MLDAHVRQNLELVHRRCGHSLMGLRIFVRGVLNLPSVDLVEVQFEAMGIAARLISVLMRVARLDSAEHIYIAERRPLLVPILNRVGGLVGLESASLGVLKVQVLCVDDGGWIRVHFKF